MHDDRASIDLMTRASAALSGDEVAALMDELSDISLGDPSPALAPIDVTPFALGARRDRPTANLSYLDRMNDRMARRLRDVIEPMAQTRAKVEAAPLETRRFDEWQRNQPDYCSLTMFRVRPVKGSMMIGIDPSFITNMVDAFYGGTGNGLATKTGEFTPSEERLLNRLVGSIVEVLTKTWGEFHPLEFQKVSHETNPVFASLVRGDEAVVVQSFTIKPGMSRSTKIEILYPLSLLQPIEDGIASRIHRSSDDENDEWRTKLEAALQNVALPVRSVLARPEMSVADLLALKVGDVIPITLSQTVPLLVGNRRFGEGTIGEQEGRAALMLDNLNKGFLK